MFTSHWFTLKSFPTRDFHLNPIYCISQERSFFYSFTRLSRLWSIEFAWNRQIFMFSSIVVFNCIEKSLFPSMLTNFFGPNGQLDTLSHIEQYQELHGFLWFYRLFLSPIASFCKFVIVCIRINHRLSWQNELQ